MKIETRNKTIIQIQEEFNKAFPFLRIEFYKSANNSMNSKELSLLKGDSYVLKPETEENIFITDEMSVNELENQFHLKCNLVVHVLRKSGKAWLETTFTNGWTLTKQNQEGHELSQL